MSTCLVVSCNVSPGATTASASYLLPGQDTFSVSTSDEVAVEYDVRTVGGNAGWDSIAYVMAASFSTPMALPYVDHEGYGESAVTAVAGLYSRMSAAGWYRRVIRVSGGSLNALVTNFRVGVWLTHPTGALPAPFAAVKVQIANVRLTNFRETLLWLWRDGMDLPVFESSANMSSSAVGIGGIASPELPSYIADAQQQQLDDLSHQRRTGGRLNSWLFWDGTKDSFTLSNVRLTEAQRWDLMTFYDLFRRESFVYRHQGNLPAVWVRFEKPPVFRPIYLAGRVFYETTVSLLRR